MSTFHARPTYGDDPEYDAYVERMADPEWTGEERDHFGWLADRAADRAQRQMDERWSA